MFDFKKIAEKEAPKPKKQGCELCHGQGRYRIGTKDVWYKCYACDAAEKKWKPKSWDKL